MEGKEDSLTRRPVRISPLPNAQIAVEGVTCCSGSAIESSCLCLKSTPPGANLNPGARDRKSGVDDRGHPGPKFERKEREVTSDDSFRVATASWKSSRNRRKDPEIDTYHTCQLETVQSTQSLLPLQIKTKKSNC